MFFNQKILPYKEVTYLLKDGKWIKDAIFEVNQQGRRSKHQLFSYSDFTQWR